MLKHPISKGTKHFRRFEAISPRAGQGKCRSLGPPRGTQRFARATYNPLWPKGLIVLPSSHHFSQHQSDLCNPLAQPCASQRRGFCPKSRAQANSLHRARCSKSIAFPGALCSRAAGNKQGPEGAQGIQLHFGFPRTHTSSSEKFFSHPRKIFAQNVKPRLGNVSSKCQQVSAGEKLIRQNGPNFSRGELLCDHCRKDECGLMVK